MSGTEIADRSVLKTLGLLRYPDSTDGFPFKIGFRFSATQPDSPCPTGMRKEENKL